MSKDNLWLDWIIELQSLAQAGLTYGKDVYDKERYTRIREISAEMMSYITDVPPEKIRELFCDEAGYQTPKIDTRAAIFQDDKVLLVQENNGTWALPGGWCDVNVSVAENTVKEVREEAGLDVAVTNVIAVQDREKHNFPPYAHRICKIFMMCSAIGGCFKENIETTASDYFAEDELPCLATEKTTAEQVKMCFDAYRAKENWKTLFD